MKCTEFETVLNELMDSRLDLKSDLRISAHAASCPPCKEELEIYASIAELAPENGTSQLAPAQAILQSPPKTIRQKKTRMVWIRSHVFCRRFATCSWSANSYVLFPMVIP